MERIKQRSRLAGDVPQFNVFVQRVGVRSERWRGAHDFVDDDRANFRAGVGGAERVGGVSHEMFDAIAADVTAKADAVDLRTEFESVPVTRDVRAVAGE